MLVLSFVYGIESSVLGYDHVYFIRMLKLVSVILSEGYTASRCRWKWPTDNFMQFSTNFPPNFPPNYIITREQKHCWKRANNSDKNGKLIGFVN